MNGSETNTNPLLEIVDEWSVEEQIEMAQESDERAAIARKQNHEVYNFLRGMAF